MKRISVLTSSVTLALALALNGCGGGGGSASANGVNIAGKAIDPYLNGATVCLDANDNGICEVNEPTAHTNAQGAYALQVAQEHHNAHHALIASGGTDMGTNTVFNGTLSAIDEASTQNITPLTTMVEARYRYCQAHHATCHETRTEIESSVAEYLGVSTEQLNADIVALANNGTATPLQVALALEASAQSHAHEHHTQAHHFYEQLGEHGFPAGHHWVDDLRTSMPKMYGLVTQILSIDEGVLENVANAGVEAGNTVANTGADTGTAAANAGVSAGEAAANAGANAGTAAANAGANAGTDAANAGVEAGINTAHSGLEVHSIANQIAQYVHGLIHQAGTDVANAGVEAGNDSSDAGTTAGTDAANTGVETGNDAADTGVTTGNDATDTVVPVGTSSGW